MSELWKDVIGFEGRYMVSNLGRIKSLPNSRRKTDLILKQTRRADGRFVVNLTYSEHGCWRQVVKQVHWLVAGAWLGKRPKKTEVCHNDGDCGNNCVENLRYDTRLSNIQDRKKHDGCNAGEKNGMSILTDAEVLEIKARLGNDENISELAKRFNISRSAISAIKNSKRWKHE